MEQYDGSSKVWQQAEFKAFSSQLREVSVASEYKVLVVNKHVLKCNSFDAKCEK